MTLPLTYADNDPEFLGGFARATSESKRISDGSLRAVQKALEEAMQSPANIDEMLKEIKALVVEGDILDSRLLDYQTLIEKANIPSTANAKILRDGFTKLLSNSRHIASLSKVVNDEFGGNILEFVQDTGIPIEVKVTELANWDARTMRKGQAAFQQPTEFARFIKMLQAYQRALRTEIVVADTTAQEELSDLVEEVSSIDNQIAEVDGNVVNPLAKYVGVGAGAFTSVFIGTPIAALNQLLNALATEVTGLSQYRSQLVVLHEKRQGLVARRNSLTIRIRALEDSQSKLGDMSTVANSIKGVEHDIVEFSGRVSRLTDVYTQIHYEQNEISQLLQVKPVTDPVIQTKLALLKGALRTNSQLLDEYSKGSISVMARF